MNRLQIELQARRIAEARQEEPEMFELCGVDIAYSLLSLSGVERIVARSEAVTNARFDQLQAELDHVFVVASAKLTDAANRIGHRAEDALDRSVYAEAYGIDDDDDPEQILKEGRWLRIRQGKFPSSAYSNKN
ncbi:MAG TPA: hypothetical protein VG964_01630 [Candidatus Saccharimonadales bacterium]|nr:hypothetical protein [Candidatus Saccharimonadales bacterium]